MLLVSFFFLVTALISPAQGSPEKHYIGPETCKSCHEKEYTSFFASSKKSHSYDTITRMRKFLTDQEFEGCMECHTTGHGKPGGFVSVEATPQLKNLSCEACHGPGSVHAESGDPSEINGKLTPKDCSGCHNENRVKAFRFSPLIHGGVHQ
ncbi:MAG: cytochrome c family protein [Candidatus Riflebacteria bacterium]|nr:cytochrome c family protein [Candidatus Riflebacteria bacterium]